MKLSRKSDYALRALFGLIASDRKTPVSIRELAEKYDVPKRFLEQIMLELKSRGWVRSIPAHGGFVLAKKPDEITMGEVVRHFDGVLAPIGCVSTTHYEPCTRNRSAGFVESYSTSATTRPAVWTPPRWLRSMPAPWSLAEEVFSAEFGGGEGI